MFALKDTKPEAVDDIVDEFRRKLERLVQVPGAAARPPRCGSLPRILAIHQSRGGDSSSHGAEHIAAVCLSV